MLHVRCGADIVRKLQAGGAPGGILVWSDPLCQGPTPNVAADAWYDIRSAFIAGAYDVPRAEARAGLVAADAALEDALSQDEIVLWFEHDLFDQSILARLLAWFDRARPAALSLVTASSHPDVSRFIGLGDLNASQLMELFHARVPVSESSLATGREAWAVWREPDPRALDAFAVGDAAGLPYLATAIRRHLEELPWVGDGLSRTERSVLRAAKGGRPGEQVFLIVAAEETAPWLGDTMCYHVIRELARLEPALIEIHGSWSGTLGDLRHASVRTTPAGDSVLAGTDRVELCGIDRWLGGVQLDPAHPLWRWDPAENRLAGGGPAA